tara:strand:+ start:3259 stop:3477 length:219 start_codon:yes stop_codon:yes gene_type:complete
MLKLTSQICELQNCNNPEGFNLKNSKKKIEKTEKEKTKPINPNNVFEGKTFKIKKTEYRSPKPIESKPIKEW